MSEKLSLLSHSLDDRARKYPKRKHAKSKPVLVIHGGGAGTMSRERSTPEQRELYKRALRSALVKGHEVLKNGGEAMDAAVAAVGVMEGWFYHSLRQRSIFNNTQRIRLSSIQLRERRCIQCGR